MQREVNLWIRFGKLTQTRHQNRARKSGRDGQAQFAFAGGVAFFVGKALENAQTLAHMRQVFAAFGGERKICAPKQLHTQQLFELLHAVADSTRCDAQLFSRLGDRAQTRQGFEGEQALNGWNAARHARGLFEDHGFVAVQQHAVFAVPLHGAGQHLALGVASHGGEVFHGFAVVHTRHILLDDGAFV